MNDITLRAINLGDTDNILKWRNSELVMNNLFSQTPLTSENHQKWLSEVVQTKKAYQFIIEIDQSIPIGTIFLKNLDYINLKCEMGIFIGEESFRGKGYSKKAISQVLHFAFKKLNMNKVYLSVLLENINAIKTYERVGFSHEGVLRHDYLRNDVFHDVVIMGLLKTEWESLYV